MTDGPLGQGPLRSMPYMLLVVATLTNMLFVAAAIAGGLIAGMSSSGPPGAGTLALSRSVTSILLNVYAMRMAAVFTLTTVTIARRTQPGTNSRARTSRADAGSDEHRAQ